MGDNFLRQQAKNFKKRRDLAVVEAGEPALFERGETVSIRYTAHPKGGQDFRGGERVYVVYTPDREQLAVVRGHKEIGSVAGPSAQVLKSALADPTQTGVAQGRVVSVAPMSGTAQIQLIAEDTGPQ